GGAGPRGVRGAGGPRPQGQSPGGQAAAGPDPGDAAGPEAGGPERPVDPGVLGVGYGPQRPFVGQRRLARAAAGLAVGPRLLAQRRRGIPVGAGLVDAGEHRRIPGDGPAFGAVPGDVLAPAP